MVRCEADIREHQESLDRSGVLIHYKHGTLVPYPLLAVVDNLERRQVVIIRSMSLNQLARDPRTVKDTSNIENDARQVLHQIGVEGLIAMPMN